MNIPIENRTFFNHYILHPFSPELSEKEQKCHLVATVALGILTACLAQIGTYLYLSLLDKVLVKEINAQVKTEDIEEESNETMSQTFQSIWKDATPQESEDIQSIWGAMMKGANINGWTKTQESRYHLTLEKEVRGTLDKVPGTIVIPQELDVEFSEEEGVKKLTFPGKKIKGVKETGFLDVFLVSVNEIHVCGKGVTVTAGLPLGSKQGVLTAEQALDAWNLVKWAK